MARRSAKRTSAPEDEFSAELPVLPVRDTVLFPRMVTPLFVGRERSLKAVEAAMAKDRTILVVAQREPEKEDISAPDLYDIGTEAVIGRVLKLPDGSSNVFVQGQRRVRIVKVTESEPIFRAIVQAVPESREPSIEADALMKSILALLEKCVELSTALSEEAYVAAMNADDPGWLADLVASSLNLPIAQRQEILETLDVGERLTRVHVILAKELSVLELQDRIQTEVQSEVGERQREDFLRDQLKQVQRELGETDPLLREVSRLRERGLETELPEAVAKKVEEELNRLATLPSAAPEVGV
ncbi:MAG: LON peptidase substrate-binding domain-containing protein, partial [Chloroflexi bacterium]|nr:LON peptidase substrate-binding domain-containing protein [Chloroflexota bacterium]